MNRLNGKNLTSIFSNAASSLEFAVERRWLSLKNEFLVTLGIKPNWAIDRDIIMSKLREILPQRHMTQMNAAAFLCVMSINHKHSQYDPVEFLNNFLKLYNAKTVQEIGQIEEIAVGSPDDLELWNVYNQTRGTMTKKIEAVKIRCWAKDLEAATSPKSRLVIPSANHKSITVKDVNELLSLYPSKPVINDNDEDEQEFIEKLKESDGSETNSAFPKDDYLPRLRKARAEGHINETQCGIILCFILHSREKRNDKKTSYVTHPMAVANLVRQRGADYLLDEKHVWMATLAALLHDGGEKSNIDLENDLLGLLPTEVIDAVRALHKRDDEPYFLYLERCANNPLAAVVKLCDIYHNSLDSGTNPAFKQTYVYPIASNYVQYRVKHPDEKLSVVEYMKKHNICSDELSPEELFEEIQKIAENRADKKKPASAYRDRLGVVKNLETISDILQTEEIVTDANPRGKEISPIQLRPDV